MTKRPLDTFFAPLQKKGAKRAEAAPPRRTAGGSAFGACCNCGADVALALMNEHLDTCLLSAANAPLAPPAAPAAAGLGTRAPAAPSPPRAAAALRWRTEAAPDGLRYGQNTGRLAGVLPPAPPPPASALDALFALDAADAQTEDDERAGGAAAAPPQQPAAPLVARTYGLAGHIVLPDLLSVDEEAELLAHVESASESPPWRPSRYNGQNRGKAWGVVMDLARREVAPAEVPFPPWLAGLVGRLRRAHPMLRRFSPNHANAIEYVRSRGDFLVAHVDDRQLSGDLIVNISLAGDAVMTYVREPRGGAPRGAAARHAGDRRPPDAPGTVRVALPRRCAQVQSGASRFEFTHQIWSGDIQDARRVSITLRESPLTRQR